MEPTRGRADPRPGTCAGFPAEPAPRIASSTTATALLILVVKRPDPGDGVTYTDLIRGRSEDGRRYTFTAKDGSSFLIDASPLPQPTGAKEALKTFHDLDPATQTVIAVPTPAKSEALVAETRGAGARARQILVKIRRRRSIGPDVLQLAGRLSAAEGRPPAFPASEIMARWRGAGRGERLRARRRGGGAALRQRLRRMGGGRRALRPAVTEGLSMIEGQASRTFFTVW